MTVLFIAVFTLTGFAASAQTQQVHTSSASNALSRYTVSSGTAQLKWDAHTKTLLTTITVSGLKPGSKHVVHIHTGACGSKGGILYPLHDLVANASGSATSSTTIKNVSHGIPATGWHVEVHTGSTEQTNALLCGNIVNPGAAATVSAHLK